MKIILAVIGKTEVGFVRQGIEEYVKRLRHYATFNIQYVGDVKGTRKGRNCLEKNAPIVADATGELFSGISDKELTAFAKTLGKLVETVAAEDGAE